MNNQTEIVKVTDKENVDQQNKYSNEKKQSKEAQFFKQRLNIMYQYPGNQEQTEIHKMATAFGYSLPFESWEEMPVCACCGYHINTIRLPVCIPTTPKLGEEGLTQTFLLQSGPSMFFTFIKLIIIFLVTLFAVVGLFSLNMANINQSYCTDNSKWCGNSWFITYSPVKNQQNNLTVKYLNMMDWLNLVMVGISIILFLYFRRYQYSIYGIVDLHNQTQDDFTMIVSKIPLYNDTSNIESRSIINYPQKLKNLFQTKIRKFIDQVETNDFNQLDSIQRSFKQKIVKEKKINPNNLGIVKTISLCFNLQDLQNILKQRDDEMQEYLKINKQQKYTLTQQPESVPINIEKINKKYLQMSHSYVLGNNVEFKANNFLGKAFVSFQFQHYRNYLIQLSDRAPEQLSIQGSNLKLDIATHPQDILWFNMKINKWMRVYYVIRSFFVMFLVIILSFAIITVIQIQQKQLEDIQNEKQINLVNESVGYGFTVLMALITYIVNYFLAKIIVWLTEKEQHQTKTKHIISLVIKILISQFLNTAGVYFLLSFRQGHHYLKDDGLVVQISNLMIISGLISIPLNFFQIDSKIQHFVTYFKCGRSNDNLFQIQLNQYNQPPQFDFADRYAYYLQQLYTLLFYSYINPICIPALVVILTLQYWIDKINLFRWCSSTTQLNFIISRWMLKLFQFSILVFATGNYYFSWKLHSQNTRFINLLAFMIAAGYSILAVFSSRYIEDLIFGVEHELETDSYTNCVYKGKFRQQYWNLNPATMFTIEPDLNNTKQFVKQKVLKRLAKIQDLKKHLKKTSEHELSQVF